MLIQQNSTTIEENYLYCYSNSKIISNNNKNLEYYIEKRELFFGKVAKIFEMNGKNEEALKWRIR